MRILLDTHALLWWLADSQELSAAVREQIASTENQVSVSAASAWEMSIKSAAGKLRTPDDLGAAIASAGFEQLPITIEHASAAGALPAHHRDPFDRMLVAQALLEGLTIITRDQRFKAYGVSVVEA